MSNGETAQPPIERDQRIDALRALALAGILQVNIQSFVQGAGNPLGEFIVAPSRMDVATFYLASAFAEYKFMPIFAMLFGAGFGLLAAKFVRMGIEPSRAFRRRFAFLFAFGLLHGTLLYFGDITNVYAALGLVLLFFYSRADAASLAVSVRRWWVAAFVVTALLALFADGTGDFADSASDVAQVLYENFVVFTTGTYVEQLPYRVSEFIVLVESVYLYGQWLPTFAWMLTGLWAMRSGWLLEPASHRRAGRRIFMLGLIIGLPFALAYAGQSLDTALDGPLVGSGEGRSAWPILLLMASSALAPLYALVFLRRAPRALFEWLAPAGRMPLTNYLLQSLAMGALLSGWGLQWGRWMTHFELMGLAVVIVFSQWTLSRLWMRRFEQGPVEAVWRRVTYGRHERTP